MDNFLNKVKEVKSEKLQISQTKKGEIITTTQRNQLKKDILNSIFKDLSEAYSFCFMTNDGIAIEIENDCIADNIKNDEGSGAVTITLDIKVKNLEYNATNEANIFEDELQEKLEKRKEQLRQKNIKMFSDAVRRDDAKKKKEEEGE